MNTTDSILLSVLEQLYPQKVQELRSTIEVVTKVINTQTESKSSKEEPSEKKLKNKKQLRELSDQLRTIFFDTTNLPEKTTEALDNYTEALLGEITPD